MGPSAGLRVLGSLLVLQVSCLEQQPGVGDETCAAGDGNCLAAKTGLKWRGYPYFLTNPGYAKTIYGGSFMKDAFRQAGFEGPMEGEDWDVLWTHRPQTKTLLETHLPRRQGDRLVNHCSYWAGAGDKCAFAQITNKLSRGKDSSTSGYLTTFELNDVKQVETWRQLVRNDPQRHWVLKQCFGGGPAGIQIKQGEDALQVDRSKPMVAQEYMDKPFSGLGGQKFHLRMYLLVTRWDPAVGAYLYHEGLVFRSMHKHVPGGERSSENDVFSGISKTVEALPLAALWDVVDVQGTGSDVGTVDSVVVRSRIEALMRELMGGLPDKGSASRRLKTNEAHGFNCFDLFGVDVLLDEDLWPWVMEMNIGANMWVDNHGPQHQDRLKQTKGVLMDQLLQWAASRSRTPPENVVAAEALERTSLKNFTRLL